uniref:Capping protein regulator and myosin 1 linker 2 n=1 Tax=Myripristis murdjan TaxID=586833 RepID=A0A667ZE81_9TELE
MFLSLIHQDGRGSVTENRISVFAGACCDILFEIVFETDRQTFSFSVLQVEDLEAMVSHMTASLKRIFPDSSPEKLLKKIPPDLQERLSTLSSVVEKQLNGQSASCGGFSDTYAALCDFNEIPCREEIQWDIDNIYRVHNWRQFNLLDFGHLDSRDLALTVAALSFNQWFTKIYCRDFRLPCVLMTETGCEGMLFFCCSDFAIKMAAALREHASPTLHSINLSANQIEDKGVIALSLELGRLAVGLQHLSLSKVSMSARGLGCLCQELSSSQVFLTTLTHLDLSGNPGSLATEEATFLFSFLSSANSLSHLDVSGTDCPLDTLFVSLSSGCCSKLIYLNLAKNPFSHRKVREVTRSVRQFFSQSCELKFVGLSATRLPPQALRWAVLPNPRSGLQSAGAQVLQEHVFEATAISSLDISDNGFENDMVTLVLSIGRCRSLRHVALGRNFAMKSRSLTDVLHRIAQLIQDEDCPLQSLSVCDSKLKAGTSILISSLGGDASLLELDISGNAIGDTGAKMLAKALLSNTRLRTLVWDRNNVTARGFQDVADALERNFTLQQVSLPLADISQSYRGNPDRTKEALHKVSSPAPPQLIQGLCGQLQDTLQPLTSCSIQEVQADVLAAEEVLHNAKESLRVLPSLYEIGSAPSDGAMVNCILTETATALTNEVSVYLQEVAQALLRCAEGVCPRVVQRSSVCERLTECVSKKSRHVLKYLKTALVENSGKIITNKLYELRQSLSMSLVESIIEQLLQDLATAQDKLDRHTKENPCSAPRNNIPQLRLVDSDFPTDEYVPAIWRSSFHCRSLRPAPSIKSLLDADWEQQRERERGGGEFSGEEGGGRGLPRSLMATPLSVTAAGRGGLPRREAPFPGRGPSPGPLPGSGSPASPMELLPTQGQTLRHYTASRPRPRRTHTQPPSSRPQEPEAEHEATDGMGRVDEGVEEFFTKKIIPDYALNTSFTSTNAPSPASSIPPPASTTTTTTTAAPPSKNIKKKFGDFFAFKRARAGRAAKAGGGEGGGGEGAKVKRTSIADLIRPLREAKEREREREREREKEREKERGTRSVDDVNVSNDAAITEGTVAADHHPPGERRDKMAPVMTVTTTAPSSEAAPLSPPTTAPDLTAVPLANPEEGVHPPSPPVWPDHERDGNSTDRKEGGTPLGERRLKVSRRSLREGKSQSLILLTGLEPDDKDSTHSKKHASESTFGFEQRLQVMLQRMGVAKTPPADTKTSQNKEEELRKANSEGAILDKPEPPPTFMKPRTMSTSSGTHHPPQLDPQVTDLPFHPKPAVPERPVGPLPPKPAIAAKPPLPAPATPAGEAAAGRPVQPHLPSSTPSFTSSSAGIQSRPPSQDGKLQVKQHRTEKACLLVAAGRLNVLLSLMCVCVCVCVCVCAHVPPLESLPKPHPRMKPLPQRRAVSVHEDTLAITQGEAELCLKAVLQRSPIRLRGNRGDLPTCTEDPPTREEAPEGDRGEEHERGGKWVQREGSRGDLVYLSH